MCLIVLFYMYTCNTRVFITWKYYLLYIIVVQGKYIRCFVSHRMWHFLVKLSQEPFKKCAVQIQIQSQLPILTRCSTIKLLKIRVTVQSQKMYKTMKPFQKCTGFTFVL